LFRTDIATCRAAITAKNAKYDYYDQQTGIVTYRAAIAIAMNYKDFEQFIVL